jgi:hypothetical protein
MKCLSIHLKGTILSTTISDERLEDVSELMKNSLEQKERRVYHLVYIYDNNTTIAFDNTYLVGYHFYDGINYQQEVLDSFKKIVNQPLALDQK